VSHTREASVEITGPGFKLNGSLAIVEQRTESIMRSTRRSTDEGIETSIFRAHRDSMRANLRDGIKGELFAIEHCEVFAKFFAIAWRGQTSGYTRLRQRVPITIRSRGQFDGCRIRFSCRRTEQSPITCGRKCEHTRTVRNRCRENILLRSGMRWTVPRHHDRPSCTFQSVDANGAIVRGKPERAKFALGSKLVERSKVFVGQAFGRTNPKKKKNIDPITTKLAERSFHVNPNGLRSGVIRAGDNDEGIACTTSRS
jgi:hypothetical protein